ncbi:hypothetical protein VP01_1329g2 [Puccinia sorghi]|uniref:Uncharacterized protein n=1 Tax=Puccinia sorghi TaxID=27349 RepID=A0A0L6VP81_9BASI|nr:hypothetical protein VP01_1329g2 [Puccinia sorghi]
MCERKYIFGHWIQLHTHMTSTLRTIGIIMGVVHIFSLIDVITKGFLWKNVANGIWGALYILRLIWSKSILPWSARFSRLRLQILFSNSFYLWHHIFYFLFLAGNWVKISSQLSAEGGRRLSVLIRPGFKIDWGVSRQARVNMKVLQFACQNLSITSVRHISKMGESFSHTVLISQLSSPSLLSSLIYFDSPVSSTSASLGWKTHTLSSFSLSESLQAIKCVNPWPSGPTLPHTLMLGSWDCQKKNRGRKIAVILGTGPAQWRKKKERTDEVNCLNQETRSNLMRQEGENNTHQSSFILLGRVEIPTFSRAQNLYFKGPASCFTWFFSGEKLLDFQNDSNTVSRSIAYRPFSSAQLSLKGDWTLYVKPFHFMLAAEPATFLYNQMNCPNIHSSPGKYRGVSPNLILDQPDRQFFLLEKKTKEIVHSVRSKLNFCVFLRNRTTPGESKITSILKPLYHNRVHTQKSLLQYFEVLILELNTSKLYVKSHAQSPNPSTDLSQVILSQKIIIMNEWIEGQGYISCRLFFFSLKLCLIDLPLGYRGLGWRPPKFVTRFTNAVRPARGQNTRTTINELKYTAIRSCACTACKRVVSDHENRLKYKILLLDYMSLHDLHEPACTCTCALCVVDLLMCTEGGQRWHVTSDPKGLRGYCPSMRNREKDRKRKEKKNKRFFLFNFLKFENTTPYVLRYFPLFTFDFLSFLCAPCCHQRLLLRAPADNTPIQNPNCKFQNCPYWPPNQVLYSGRNAHIILFCPQKIQIKANEKLSLFLPQIQFQHTSLVQLKNCYIFWLQHMAYYENLTLVWLAGRIPRLFLQDIMELHLKKLIKNSYKSLEYKILRGIWFIKLQRDNFKDGLEKRKFRMRNMIQKCRKSSEEGITSGDDLKFNDLPIDQVQSATDKSDDFEIFLKNGLFESPVFCGANLQKLWQCWNSISDHTASSILSHHSRFTYICSTLNVLQSHLLFFLSSSTHITNSSLCILALSSDSSPNWLEPQVALFHLSHFSTFLTHSFLSCLHKYCVFQWYDSFLVFLRFSFNALCFLFTYLLKLCLNSFSSKNFELSLFFFVGVGYSLVLLQKTRIISLSFTLSFKTHFHRPLLLQPRR